MYEPARFSLNQLYAGLEYLGSEYEKIFEIYNHQINRKYPFDTSHTYFDCINIYFEIDREDAFRPKEPSKENRKDPIVGTGLLLDTHQIPIGMKLYPGTESEKPVIPKVIDDLKSWNNISGKKIQVREFDSSIIKKTFAGRINPVFFLSNFSFYYLVIFSDI